MLLRGVVCMGSGAKHVFLVSLGEAPAANSFFCVFLHYMKRILGSGGATLWQSSANALPLCYHALPVALPVFYNNKTKTMPITGLCYYHNPFNSIFTLNVSAHISSNF